MGPGWRCSRFSCFLRTVAAVALLCLLSAPPGGAQNAAIDLHGNAADPLKLSPGKVVVLIFVRTDCPVSNRYAPTIQKISAAYASKAAFWLVYPGKSETAETIRKHERGYGYTFAALRDPQHVLVKQTQVQITPEVAVFDRDRRLVYHGRIDNLYVEMGRTRSVATTHELEDAIRAADEGKAVAIAATQSVGCYISDLE